MMAHRNGEGGSKNAIISNEKRCRGLTPLVWHKCIVLRVPSIREILILPLVSTLPTNPCKIEGTLEPLLGVALWTFTAAQRNLPVENRCTSRLQEGDCFIFFAQTHSWSRRPCWTGHVSQEDCTGHLGLLPTPRNRWKHRGFN